MAEIINGVPIGDLPGIESVPDDSMLVVEFLGKAYHMPGAVLRQMIQDVLDSMGDSVDDVTEARLTAAIETVLASGKYNGVSPSVEVLDEEDGTSVIHVIDAFGDKRYPVEVKGATDAVRYKPQSLTDAQKKQARANIGALSAADISDKDNEVVIVKISGSFDAGYTVLWGGLPAPAGGLNALVENGSIVIGIADGDLTFPLAGFDDYTVPSGTVFSYSPHDFSNNGTFWVNHVRDFQGMPDNKSCVLKSQSDGSVWTASVITEQYTFYLTGDYPGRILQYDGVQLLADRAFEILQDAVNNDAPIFCFQKDAAFEVEDGSTYTPPIGTPFYYNSEAGAFRCERDGFDCTLTVGMFGYTVIAEKTTPYKTAESKADDLKEEDGTLFLLSAGEPIGAGVPLPTGNADDCKIFIADLNTSTYEDIKAADDAGKICYALWGGYTACMLTTLSPESAIFTTLLDPHLGLYVKFTKGTVGVSDFGLTESHSVLYEPQSLTDAQKAQARENIGALSADDIDVDSIGSNVFVADYDTTTFAEIKAAHDARKVCFLDLDGLMLPLLYLSDTEAVFVREVNDTTDYKATVTSAGGKDVTLVDKNTPIYVAQTLTDAQKAQARTNIGALGTGGGTITGALSINDKLTQGSPSVDASVASMNRFHSDLFVQGNGTAPNTPTVAGFYLGKSTSDENRHMDIVSGGDYSYIDFNKAGRGTDFDARLLVNVSSGWTDFTWGSHGDITQRVFNVNGSLRQNGTEVLTRGNAGTDSILPVRLRTYQDHNNAVSDPNLATETGFYYVNTATNRPPFSQSTNPDYRVLTTAYSDQWLQQIATDFRCGDMFLRRRENGTWTPWVRFATAGDLSGYLPLGGGLLGGSLKFQASSLPQKSLEYVCGIDAFASGGEMGWQSKAEFLNGYALKSDIPTNYAKLKTYNDFVHDSNEITMVPDGYSQGLLYFNYRTGAGQQNGNINNYLFCNGKGSTAGVTLTADAFSGTAARATADANGNNIANTYAKVTTANDYDGEQRFKNSAYCPTITDTVSGIGCAFKASRGMVNELLADKIIATASTGKIPFYSYTGASNGSMTGLTEFAYLSPGAFILRPPSGEGGQIQLEAAANDPTNTGICIDTAGGNFRIFGLQSADGVTTTGYGSVLAIHPYAKVITGGYSFDGIAAKATADGNGRNIVSTYATKDEVVTAANGALRVNLSGNASSGYRIDKTFAEIQSAWNVGRKVYLYNGHVFNLNYMQEDFMAVFTSVILSNNSVSIQSATILASDSSVFSFETKTL